MARSLTSSPQLAPIWSWEMSSSVTPTVSMIAWVTSALSALVSSSVWTRIEFSPEVVTTGVEAFLMPRSPTASRSASALSWVTFSLGSVTLYWVPPVNSMP